MFAFPRVVVCALVFLAAGSHAVQRDSALADVQTENGIGATCLSSGDPHFRNFDGTAFHFQGMGQFTLVKSPNFELQVRTVKCGAQPSSTFGFVTCNKDVAFRSGKDIVQFVNGVVKINGKAANVVAGGPLVSLATGSVGLVNEEHRYWANDRPTQTLWKTTSFVFSSTVGIKFRHTNDIVEVYVPPSLKGSVSGLCGTWSGNAKTSFVDSQGKAYVLTDFNGNSNSKPVHQWGLSWMVTGTTASLFDTPASTVNNVNFQAAPAVWASDKLKSDAEKACGGAALDLEFYDDCMSDIRHSGSLDAAEVSRKAQALSEKFTATGTFDSTESPKLMLLNALTALQVKLRNDLEEISALRDAEAKTVAQLKAAVAAAVIDLDKQGRELATARTSLSQSQAEVNEDTAALAAANKALEAVRLSLSKQISTIDAEIALVQQLAAKVGTLEGVKDLDVGSHVTQLLQEHRVSTQSTQIKTALATLTDKLQKERAALGLQKEQKRVADAEAKLATSRKQLQAAQFTVETETKQVALAQDVFNRAQAAVNQASADQAINNKNFDARISEINQELNSLAMVRSKVEDWFSNRDITPKLLAELDLSDINDKFAKPNHYESHKTTLTDILAKLEKQLTDRLAAIEAERKKHAEEVAAVERLLKDAQTQAATKLDALTKAKAAVDVNNKLIGTVQGQLDAAQKTLRDLQAEFAAKSKTVLAELAVIQELKTLLGQLVAVGSPAASTAASVVSVKLAELEKSMKERNADEDATNLVQVARASAETDTIGKLLDDLIAQLNRELVTPADIAAQQKLIDNLNAQLKEAQSKILVLQQTVTVSEKEYNDAAAQRTALEEKLARAKKDQASADQARNTEAGLINQELASTRWLSGKIKEWMTSHTVTPKTLLETDSSVDAEDDDSVDIDDILGHDEEDLEEAEPEEDLVDTITTA